MARREATIQIASDGRDKGGIFVLREMGAIPATDWFIRAVQCLGHSGIEVPAGMMNQGAEMMAAMGFGTILLAAARSHWGEMKPLLDELLGCISSYQPPGGQIPLTGSVILGQIEEPATIFQLYEEVLSLHLGFSLRARLSEFQEEMAQRMRGTGQNTETSMPEPAL